VNAGDECFELDGPEGSFIDDHILTNGTVYAGNAAGLVDMDNNSRVSMNNIYFFGIAEGQAFDQLPVAPDGFGEFSDFEAVIPDGFTVADFFLGGSDAFTTSVTEGNNTVGADVTKFNGWTWAETSGALSGLGL
jgi:hypothetical protein